MNTKKGREYEHGLSTLVARATDGTIVPLAAGYNGQYAQDVDMLIDDGEAVHVFELKRTSQDAYTLYWDEEDRNKDDLYGLCKFCVEYPRPAYPYAGVRFDRKQLTLSKIYLDDYPDQEALLENAATLCQTDASATRGGNLRFQKPGSEWPYEDLDAKDAEHVIETIGYSF